MNKIKYTTPIKWVVMGCVMLLVTSCENNAPQQPAVTGQNNQEKQGEIFACPMHPEITGVAGDKCSKCGMDLEANDDKISTEEFMMVFKSNPETFTPQTNATLFFTPKIKGKETENVPLDLVHDKKIHLIVVSNDLSYFDHVHPEYQPGGDYKLDVTNNAGVKLAGPGNHVTQFPSGGSYTLYADYLPTGAPHQLDQISLQVEGSEAPRKTWNKENLNSTDGEFSMTIKPSHDHFYTHAMNHIEAPISMKGKPILTSDLDDLLGAKAHMVVIGVNDMSYLHVHPEINNGYLDLHASFEKSGFYRGWVQFKYKGVLHTMSFVLEVLEGSANQSDESNGEHSHDHSHTH